MASKSQPVSPAQIAAWRREEAVPFKGWDFSHLAGRWTDETPPWSYVDMASALLRTASSALDLGTGGGERLLALRDAWPPRMAATEGHPPNLALARTRLAPLGVQVVAADGSLAALLPFGDDEFEVVTDRHTAFNAAEVERVLKPGGILLTQQVDGNSTRDLIEAMGSKPKWPWYTLSFALAQVAKANLVVEMAREWTGRMTFADVGAVVYYLKAVPWLVEGFSVDGHLGYLERLQQRMGAQGRLEFTSKYLVLQARKPARSVVGE